MKSKPGTGARLSVGPTAIRGQGPGTRAIAAQDAVTTAFARIASGRNAGPRDLNSAPGRLRIRVPHDAGAQQIELALRDALRKRSLRQQ